MESQFKSSKCHQVLKTLVKGWHQQTVGLADGGIVDHQTPMHCMKLGVITGIYCLLSIIMAIYEVLVIPTISLKYTNVVKSFLLSLMAAFTLHFAVSSLHKNKKQTKDLWLL